MLLVKKPKNLTEGGLFWKILLYALPVIMAGIMQKLYNTADQIVVGQFSGDANALAAIGSTSTVTSIVLRLVIGISAGTSVVVAQYWGAKRHDDVKRSVHTSMTFAMVGGVIVAFIGIFVARPMLTWLGTKPEIYEAACNYAMIIFIGTPATAIYNFGSAIMRATGDSTTPLYILAVTGLSNIGFNLLFVLGFGMSVEGVAIATIIAQYLSAFTVLYLLGRSKERSYRLEWRHLRIDTAVFKRILKIGVPSAIQGMMFSVSNLFMLSTTNTFTTPEISGKTISASIEEYVSLALDGVYQGTLTFTGQNYGAGKKDRVKKTFFYSLVHSVSVAVILSGICLLFARPIASIFVESGNVSREAILDAAVLRMSIMLPSMFLQGIMNTTSGYLRGLGCSLPPMLAVTFSSCFLRILYLFTLFPMLPHSFVYLYMVYPITWTICFLINFVNIAIFAPRAFAKKSLAQMSEEEKEKEKLALT